MRKSILIFFFLSSIASAQQFSVKGLVVDKQGNGLGFASVAILHPTDSTLAFFAITNVEGQFEIRNVVTGEYLLQSAYLGYKTLYRSLKLPLASDNDVGALVMQPAVTDLSQVEIAAEKIPLLIKKDTIEYNAGAFKTKPDAVVEDLLKKLPGVEVDRAGNVKAQGEDVKKVLVDGKEFFGDDPKVATRNLPADAIKKVQVFNKKSEQSELTGIDDGERDKTINLLLKEDKKSAWFGDVEAGGGTDDHYQATGRVYRFTGKSQFAALGMANNINQFGFSMRDYLTFNGGIRGLMNGESETQIGTDGDNTFPVNFGQQVTGLITSGAGGLNYTFEPKKGRRFNVSYLGNGGNKKLEERTTTINFTDNNSFNKVEDSQEESKTNDHRLNFNIRNNFDSTQNIISNGGVELVGNNLTSHSFSRNFFQNVPVNDLDNHSFNNGSALVANTRAVYLKTHKGKWKVFKLSGDISAKENINNIRLQNLSQFPDPGTQLNSDQFQDNRVDFLKYSLGMSATRDLGRNFYLQPELNAGMMNEVLERRQGIFQPAELLIDSVSPHFVSRSQWLRPGLNLKRNSENVQVNFLFAVETGKLENNFSGRAVMEKEYMYFLPGISFRNEYQQGRRIAVSFGSKVNSPGVKQLLSVTDNTNPLQLFTGNRDLRPEYNHNLRFTWWLFDQFSFTSVFVNLNAGYTHDKINWSRTINNDLTQSLTLVNVADDYQLDAMPEFTTPIRMLGVNLHIDGHEGWNQGLNYVNKTENITTNLDHGITLSFDNRKKEKWDISAGGSLKITNVTYSVQQSLNNTYFNYTYFSEVSYTPNDHWRFLVSADVTHYAGQGFDQSVDIPLLKAEIAHYFLKSKRVILTLEGFDLLNRNTGLQRISELNYLLEKQSNIIGRYVMLSIKFRISKFEDKSMNGVNIKINGK